MEKEKSDNMDGKGVRNRPKLTIVHGKGVSPKKKDSDLAQIVVHKSSSSSVQENEPAPLLPDSVDHNKKNLEETSDTNISISRTVAEDGVFPPPQVEEGTSAFGGHATVVLYDFFGKEKSSKNKDSDSNQIIVTNESSPSSIQENVTDPVALPDNRRSSECRILYRCRYCATSCINYKSFVRHEKRHRDYEPDNRPTVSTQYNNSSARYTTPKKPRSKLPQSGQPKLGFDRRQGTSSSLSFSEIRKLQGVNDGSIDLLSRVGASNSSLENHDDDGKHDQDQDQDHNNHEDDDGTFDLLSRVGRKPS